MKNEGEGGRQVSSWTEGTHGDGGRGEDKVCSSPIEGT